MQLTAVQETPFWQLNMVDLIRPVPPEYVSIPCSHSVARIKIYSGHCKDKGNAKHVKHIPTQYILLEQSVQVTLMIRFFTSETETMPDDHDNVKINTLTEQCKDEEKKLVSVVVKSAEFINGKHVQHVFLEYISIEVIGVSSVLYGVDRSKMDGPYFVIKVSTGCYSENCKIMIATLSCAVVVSDYTRGRADYVSPLIFEKCERLYRGEGQAQSLM